MSKQKKQIKDLLEYALDRWQPKRWSEALELNATLGHPLPHREIELMFMEALEDFIWSIRGVRHNQVHYDKKYVEMQLTDGTIDERAALREAEGWVRKITRINKWEGINIRHEFDEAWEEQIGPGDVKLHYLFIFVDFDLP